MVCHFLSRELRFGIITRSVVRFLDRTVCRAMGCFFGCLRVSEDRSRPHLAVPSSNTTERAVSRNQLSSLFLDEEKGECPSKDLGSPQIDKSLKDEAKFLKACGTIPETPAEIRKASRKFKQSPPCGGDSQPSKFKSWLPNASMEKLQLDKQSDQHSTPMKLFEALERRSDSPENTPTSCISNAANSGRLSVGSIEGSEETTVDKTVKIDIVSSSAYRGNKSVRFECESSSKSENGDQNSNKLELPGNQGESKPSPNPTPLKLSDEMQTPGTVFPSNLANGKTQIRSQYVYSVSSSAENGHQLNAMKEEPSSSNDMLRELKGSPQQPENSSPKVEVGLKETFLTKESEVEGSLSSWLKPKTLNIDDNYEDLQTTRKVPRFGRTPGDRPIIGMVAAHWNEEESSRISPKWWDGNGIPNSTNKYKEDQKVSWHATPFEERLEKALSDESLISQRKLVNQTPVVFEETDESDTAISQLRPSSHTKSVVSF